MRDTKSMAFARFVMQIFETIQIVFERKVDANELMQWLLPIASNSNSLTLLMHDEPLYVAADFLGIDRFSSDFEEIEQKYIHTYSKYLDTNLQDGRPRLGI